MILALTHPDASNPHRTGAKAARLAALCASGYPVPEGIVVTTDAFSVMAAALPADATPERVADEPLPEAVDRAVRLALRPGGLLHGVPVAVRSSAVAEDMAGASFAGQYDTFLDLRSEDEVVGGVRRCFASGYAARVQAYKAAHGRVPAGMAVLVQRFVAPEAAGVAFTANPVTGDRSVVTISAVPGVGESLVSGHRNAEEWAVRGGVARRQRSVAPVLDDATAVAVAALARRVEADAGRPQDIEWAVARGRVVLLQARPMTALPEPVQWKAPLPGGWVRHFRLGEWLGDPVTPLFESWLLARVEARFSANCDALFGWRIPEPQHVIVNGWYFYGLPTPRVALREMPRMLWRILTHFREAAAMTPPTAHLGYAAARRKWSQTLMPEYARAVADAERTLDDASAPELVRIVDGLADRVGDQFTSILAVAGFAAKAEYALLKFWKAHLGNTADTPFHLIRGIDEAAVGGHAVQGLDWYLPTLGETHGASLGPDAATRERVRSERTAIEVRVRSGLAARGSLLKRFDRLVATAREAHAVRQQQTGLFTLAWPVFRRAIGRLGTQLADRGAIAAPDDVFFFSRDEVLAAVEGAGRAPDTSARRAQWTRQRDLTPPLVIGELTGIWKATFAEIDMALHGAAECAPNEIRGMPGSPGRVTARARVVRRLEELDRLQPGEILVAPVTTPGWTPAFARAAAVVTDTGSVASHASIVAREYGLPAVVATGDATARLSDGQSITVDGSRGVVLMHAAG